MHALSPVQRPGGPPPGHPVVPVNLNPRLDHVQRVGEKARRAARHDAGRHLHGQDLALGPHRVVHARVLYAPISVYPAPYQRLVRAVRRPPDGRRRHKRDDRRPEPLIQTDNSPVGDDGPRYPQPRCALVDHLPLTHHVHRHSDQLSRQTRRRASHKTARTRDRCLWHPLAALEPHSDPIFRCLQHLADEWDGAMMTTMMM